MKFKLIHSVDCRLVLTVFRIHFAVQLGIRCFCDPICAVIYFGGPFFVVVGAYSIFSL